MRAKERSNHPAGFDRTSGSVIATCDGGAPAGSSRDADAAGAGTRPAVAASAHDCPKAGTGDSALSPGADRSAGPCSDRSPSPTCSPDRSPNCPPSSSPASRAGSNAADAESIRGAVPGSAAAGGVDVVVGRVDDSSAELVEPADPSATLGPVSPGRFAGRATRCWTHASNSCGYAKTLACDRWTCRCTGSPSSRSHR